MTVFCVLCDSVAAVQAAPARPDRSLYSEAKSALGALKASAKLQARRTEWEKVVLRFRKVVARYPRSPYCDDALLSVGNLYGEMAARFRSPRYADDAVQAYEALAKEYPSSSLGEQALYAVFEIAQRTRDRKRIAEAGRSYLDAFPDASRAAEVKAALRRRVPAQAAAAIPNPPPKGLARVFDLRFWSGQTSTRVVLDLEKKVPIRHDRIGGPDRLWVDLIGTRLHPNLKDRAFPVGDGFLDQVRVGQNRDDVVRVVLDFKDVEDHSVFYLQDPPRLVIDVRGAARPAVASAQAPPPSPAPAAPATPLPGRDEPESLPTRRIAGLTPPETPPSPEPERRPTVTLESPPARRATTPPSPSPTPAPRTGTARAEPSPPQPPQVNRTGSYSLARQLGLGARKIVIDAGHGGHDPGTIGRGGLQEKDLVLDVALRLEKLVRAELNAEVVMTRATDVFIPLEERTGIANSKGADLFLSIHANSSRNPRARGIETYFLNFARNAHAEEVAARENAISAATLKDLQGLVKAITLNSKIDESRDFAASVQEALVGSLKPHYPEVQDRGVHTAPFYVLIGANMPSILAEVAFVSHPGEEKLLKSGPFRDRLARSLLEGVGTYLDALSRTQTRQLTSRTRDATVASRGGRR